MLILNGSTPRIPVLMVDSTDDETAETGLTVTVQISKNGGTFATTTNSATEVGNGWYYVALTVTETNTDGPLMVRATGTGADEWRDYHQVYTRLAADATAISGDTTAADNLEAAADGTGYNLGGGSVVAASVTGAVGSVTGNVGGNVTGSVGSLATQAKADVNAEVDTAISDAALATAANLATVDSNVDAILVDTGTTLPATLSTIAGYVDTEVAAIKAVTDNLPDSGALTSLATAANLATVDTVVDAIKAKTDSLTFTTAGQVDATTVTNSDKTGYSISGTKTTLDDLNDVSTSDVNAQVADVIKTDTIPELTADPGATPTLEKAVMLLYMATRNERNTTATTDEISNNAGTTILTGAVSDDGTTFTRGKLA